MLEQVDCQHFLKHEGNSNGFVNHSLHINLIQTCQMMWDVFPSFRSRISDIVFGSCLTLQSPTNIAAISSWFLLARQDLPEAQNNIGRAAKV